MTGASPRIRTEKLFATVSKTAVYSNSTNEAICLAALLRLELSLRGSKPPVLILTPQSYAGAPGGIRTRIEKGLNLLCMPIPPPALPKIVVLV